MSKSHERAAKKRKRDSKGSSLMNPRKPKMQVEKKNWDERLTSQIDTVTFTAGVIQNCFRPGYNATPQGHIGRKVLAKSLTYRWTVRLNDATATTGDALRLVIIHDKQPNGALPAVSQVFVNNDIGSMKTLDFSKRFTTLVDETYQMINTVDSSSMVMEGYRKINLETEFNQGNAQAIADINTGSYFAITWQTGNITSIPIVDTLFIRIRFQDV